MPDEPASQHTVISSVPSPDPTVLTTQGLTREVLALKELFNTRFAAQDQNLQLLRENLERRPIEIQQEVKHLKLLTDESFHVVEEKMLGNQKIVEEKFRSVQVQFVERDVRTETTSKDSKVAVDAALQAAKEAVAEQNRSSALAIAKSEGSTIKTIDQQSVLIASATSALNDKISDLKDRLTRLEGVSTGKSDAWGYLVGAVGMIIAITSIAMNLYRK